MADATPQVGDRFIAGYRGMARAGQVWKTNGRKGPLTLRLLEDFDAAEDRFFEAEIVEGKAQFLSLDYRMAQHEDGLGTEGTSMPFRTGLCLLHELVESPST